jgi:serine protease AprX
VVLFVFFECVTKETSFVVDAGRHMTYFCQIHMTDMYRIIFLTCVLLAGIGARAQDRYWVYLMDKDGVAMDICEVFHPSAVERRVMNGLSFPEYSDFPVREDYIVAISELVDQVVYPSAWFNAVYVIANETQIARLSEFNWIKEIRFENPSTPVLCGSNSKQSFLEQLADRQRLIMGSDFFDSLGLDGMGVRIAVFDGGFPEVNSHGALEHILKAGRVDRTFDFSKNKREVFRSNSHGLSTTSNIGGIWDGKKIGFATGATFLLAITEINREIYKEEVWWLAAAEWADRNGAQIINSSLGYTYHRYFPHQMDGATSTVSKAATMASEKGILVVNSAGNEGSDGWTVIGAPADAALVMSVGGIDPMTEMRIDFTSFGPTADGRRKPNVSAPGTTVAAIKGNKLGVVNGTSFSAPLVSGFAACVLQHYPGISRQDLFEKIEKSGHLFPYYDYVHGYGVPQARLAISDSIMPQPTFKLLKQHGHLKVLVEPTPFLNQRTNRFLGKEYLYFHLEDKNGKLLDYKILDVYQSEVYSWIPEDLQPAFKLRIHYKGYTKTINLKD